MTDTEMRQSPIKLKKWVPWLVIAVLVLVVIVLCRSVWSGRAHQEALESELQLQREAITAMRAERAAQEIKEGLVHDGVPVVTGSIVSDQLHSLQQLVTAEYFYTNSGKYESQKQVTIVGQNVNIPLTGNRFIVAYDGCIKVGVSLDEAKIVVDDAARTVTVTLPSSRILAHETYEDTLVVLDETTNIFNPITISDYSEFVDRQKDSMEKKAVDHGVLIRADSEAQALVKSCLSLLPGIGAGEGEYRLVVK